MHGELNMHNLVSRSQLNGWNFSEIISEEEDRINDYYSCLIECIDDSASCKRICKEVLIT